MAEGLVSISEQFKGLPMADLIGAPLKAACDASKDLANAKAQFIQEIGFVESEGKTVARTVDFDVTRPGQTAGSPAEKLSFKAPLLAIVDVPNLQIDLVDITFDMKVKSHTEDTSKSHSEASVDVTAGANWGWGHASVKAHGAVSSDSEHKRSSDNSATYHVQVKATGHPQPEGLMKILDYCTQACEPHSAEADGSEPNTPAADPPPAKKGKG
jgi:hypothetical protein